MTGWVVFGIAIVLIVVASLAIHYQRDAAGLPEYEDDLAGVRIHDQQTAALARATRTDRPA